MVFESFKNSVRDYLYSSHMFTKEQWLSGCVEYFCEDSTLGDNVEDLQRFAKEQWLSNDLKNICPGCLPANLRSEQNITLNGQFVLQMNAALDIGTTEYQQYMKLLNVKFEDKIPSHRMSTLFMTDGVQDIIFVIEYKLIRNLSSGIVPGCKVLLKGPIECRGGIILITESSIEMLGGYVKDFFKDNPLAALMTTKLNPSNSETQSLQPTMSLEKNTDLPTLHPDLPPRTSTNEQTLQSVAINTSHLEEQTEPIDDADVIDIEQRKDEGHLTNPSEKSIDNNVSNPNKKLKTDMLEQNISINDSDDYILDQVDEEYLKQMVDDFDLLEKQDGVKSVASKPFVYIKQINDLSPEDKIGKVFRVKGQIMKIIPKLSVGTDRWTLRCTIVDGTGAIDVDFSSDVVSKLIGFTPQEMNRLKEEMAEKPELEEKAFEALQKLKETLQLLCCIIELNMLEVPKITSLTPFGEEHVDQLFTRIERSGL